jgi:hypothetical protein
MPRLIPEATEENTFDTELHTGQIDVYFDGDTLPDDVENVLDRAAAHAKEHGLAFITIKILRQPSDDEAEEEGDDDAEISESGMKS